MITPLWHRKLTPNVKPPIMNFHGNFEAARLWRGPARKRVVNLMLKREFMTLQQHKEPPWKPVKGITVNVRKQFDLIFIDITAEEPEEGVEIKEPEEEYLDLRFFCRVGNTDDVVADIFGDVVVDNTRYYWIDFGVISGEDAIEIYDVDAEVESGSTIVKTPSLSNEDFYDVINIPGDHTQTKAFHLTNTDVDGNISQQRFIAGYHFFAKHDDDPTNDPDDETARRDILLIDILPASFGSATVNRFYANLDDWSMVWAAVEQEFSGPPGFSISSGGIRGVIYKVEYTSETGWDLVKYAGTAVDIALSFSLNPVSMFAAGATSDYTNDTVYLPAGVMSDIHELSEETVVVSLSWREKPYHATYSLNFNNGVISGDTLVAQTSMSQWRFISTGFEQEEVYTYEYENAKNASDSGTDTTVVDGSCCDISCSVGADCNDYTHTGDNVTIDFYEQSYSYSETHTGQKSIHMDMGGGSYESDETSTLVKSTSVGVENFQRYCIANNCTGGHCLEVSSGGCAATQGPAAAKAETANATGWHYESPDARTPGNNIDAIYDITYAHNWVIPLRQAQGYDAAPFHYRWLDDQCVEPGSLSWGEFVAGGDQSTPCKCDDGGLKRRYWATAGWGQYNFTLSKDCGIPAGGGSSLPALTSADGKTWTGAYTGSGSSTSTVDEYYVDSYTHDIGNVSSIAYLDDRTALDTHGLAIAIKSPTTGSWMSVMHGEDGVTATPRNKIVELELALETAGKLGDGDFIYDIGLI